MVQGTITIGTSLTGVFAVTVEEPGDYSWDAILWIVHNGSPTGFTATNAFSGTITQNVFAVERYTASAVACSVHTSFGTSASSVFILGRFNGLFRVTVPGVFNLGCTRTGGTSSIVQPGSFIEMFKVS